MLRILFWSVVAPILLIVVVILGLFGYRAYKVAENSKAYAITTPNGINEAMFVKIGGVDQWITIRGEDRNNPVILMLHGGPGSSTRLLVPFFKPWEKHFTFVQWDQRGAGKSFAPLGDKTPGMTMTQIIADGLELSDYLRNYLHKDKIILIGHSWGAMLGISLAHQRPDLYYAYVGTGQVVDYASKETAYYKWTLEQAKARGDAKILAELERIGRPPYPFESMMVQRKIGNFNYASDADKAMLPRLLAASFFAPSTTWTDLQNNTKGTQFSLRALYGDATQFDARKLGPDFALPIFMFQGDADVQTPTAFVQAYLDSINAPHKKLVILKGGGHTALLTMTDAFLAELLAHVRPLALAPANNAGGDQP